ncbi:uncharacterized protein LOC115415941 [Sphaeramia orbicularis]|uniref:uncharacterized protein LOC115415941 n=1 Tax=Sphaeramia orbicularis TaxID=375764 RepID=UPI00117F5D10|nr:uncharacterized protein LOC115415941 [Sphaeramia orbicularis]
MPNVTVKRCTTLNPATLLPTAEDGEPHCREAALEQTCSPRPDISDVPLSNPDFVFFTDGSSFKDVSGTNRVGFAVCTSVDTVSSGPLPSHYSAQAAELVALTEACKLAEGQSVTIFTDSRYAFSVVHDFGALWKHRKFLKSDGKPILNASLVAHLLDAVLLPSAIAVVKCQAHQKDDADVTQGNSRADAAARAAASLEAASSFLSQQSEGAPPASLSDTQSFETPDERRVWASCGCALDSSSVWPGHEQPHLPFDHHMMDFVELFPAEGKKYLILHHRITFLSRPGLSEDSHRQKSLGDVTAIWCGRVGNTLICISQHNGQGRRGVHQTLRLGPPFPLGDSTGETALPDHDGRLLKDIGTVIRSHYVGMAHNCRLEELVRHAQHAQDVVRQRQKDKDDKQSKSLSSALTLLAMPRNDRERRGWGKEPGNSRGPPAAGRRVGPPSREGACHFCGQQGHWKRDCPQRKRRQPRGGNRGGD